MEVTTATWIIAIGGLALVLLLGALQFVAVIRPRSDWTVENVYGGDPTVTDPKAYFAPSGPETWRIYLKREREWWEIKGKWAICGIEQR